MPWPAAPEVADRRVAGRRRSGGDREVRRAAEASPGAGRGGLDPAEVEPARSARDSEHRGVRTAETQPRPTGSEGDRRRRREAVAACPIHRRSVEAPPRGQHRVHPQVRAVPAGGADAPVRAARPVPGSARVRARPGAGYVASEADRSCRRNVAPPAARDRLPFRPDRYPDVRPVPARTRRQRRATVRAFREDRSAAAPLPRRALDRSDPSRVRIVRRAPGTAVRRAPSAHRCVAAVRLRDRPT